MTVKFVAGVSAKTNDGRSYSGLVELEAESETGLLACLLAWVIEKSIDLSTIAYDFVRTSIFRGDVLIFSHASEPVDLLVWRTRQRLKLPQAA